MSRLRSSRPSSASCRLALELSLQSASSNWLNGSVVNLSGLYGSDFGLQGVPLDDGLSLTVGAVLLGWVGAWLAVARHLRELAPR